MKEPTFSIAQLSALTRRDRRWVERRLGPSASANGRFKLSDMLPRLCADDPPSAADLAETANRQRRAQAEADLAEMKMMEKAGKIILREKFQMALKGWAIKTSGGINSLRLHTKDKAAVLAVMRESLEAVASELEGDSL